MKNFYLSSWPICSPIFNSHLFFYASSIILEPLLRGLFCLLQLDPWKDSLILITENICSHQWVLPRSLSAWEELWHHAGDERRKLALKCNSYSASRQFPDRLATSAANECVKKNVKTGLHNLEGRVAMACTSAAGWQNGSWVKFSRRIWLSSKRFPCTEAFTGSCIIMLCIASV